MPHLKSVRSNNYFKGLRVLVTAGPTREFLDPVRFLSNPSSGKMGYAIANEASGLGARVTLISGPISLIPMLDQKIKLIPVTTANQMYRAVMKEYHQARLIFMVAAVSDWRPARISHRKLKIKKRWPLSLVPTRDILEALGRKKRKNQFLVGFAAETEKLIPNARAKMKKKNCDLMVVNKVGGPHSGFEDEKNSAILLSRNSTTPFPLTPKKRLARQILQAVSKRFSK